MTIWWLAYIALGAFAGFFAGLLGIGGGSVMVPILVMLFAAQGFPSGEVMHLALGTSMAAILFTSISSVRTHHAHGAVLWPIVKRITPGIVVGTLLGTHIASLVPTKAPLMGGAKGDAVSPEQLEKIKKMLEEAAKKKRA